MQIYAKAIEKVADGGKGCQISDRVDTKKEKGINQISLMLISAKPSIDTRKEVAKADFSNIVKVNSNEELIKKAEVSNDTIAKVKVIEAKASEEVKTNNKTWRIGGG